MDQSVPPPIQVGAVDAVVERARSKKSGPLSKTEIVELIRPHMPSGSTDRQCANKVDNLMRKMKLEYGAKSIALNGRRVWSLT